VSLLDDIVDKKNVYEGATQKLHESIEAQLRAAEDLSKSRKTFCDIVGIPFGKKAWFSENNLKETILGVSLDKRWIIIILSVMGLIIFSLVISGAMWIFLIIIACIAVAFGPNIIPALFRKKPRE